MQLGLFLKGIGLSLSDALAFWKQAFSRRTPPEKFDKEYAYNIRHNYGKEGKRVQYTPYGCMKIISSQPGVGDHHGCPFRHSDEDQLMALLKSRGIDREGQDQIRELVQGHHYQVACTRVWSLTHGNTSVPDTVGNHPNAYFDASRQYNASLQGGTQTKLETQPQEQKQQTDNENAETSAADIVSDETIKLNDVDSSHQSNTVQEENQILIPTTQEENKQTEGNEMEY